MKDTKQRPMDEFMELSRDDPSSAEVGSQHYLRAVFESVQDIIFVKDRRLKYVYINPSFEKLLEVPAIELIGQTDEDIFGKEVSARTKEMDSRVLRGEISTEELTITPKGVPVTLHIIKVPLRSSSGRITGLCGIARDITDRKKAESALMEMEEKYRTMIENANFAIVVIQDGIIKFLNPKTSDNFGLSKDELLNRDFLNFVFPDDRDTVLDYHLKILKGEDAPRQYNFRIVDKDGNVRWMSANTVSILWEGRPAALNFLSDITEKRKMEEELIKADRLESIGTLAGGIAHDFNNILTAIMGNISLAKMYAAPGDRIHERLTEAERASFRARDLTQQLLTFSRGGAPIVKTTSIAQLLRDTVSFALSGSKVRCEFLIPDNLHMVEIDEGQMSQAINNIIMNADQAMPDGGTIRVCAENVIVGTENYPLLKPGKYVKVSIEDEGIGIPEGNLPRIFDPYFTTKQKGSGLGLTIAYSIIKKHGGYITVESKLGVGTKVFIYLPVSTRRTLKVEEEEDEKPTPGRGRILVMDDEEIIRDLVFEALTEIGYEVSVATNGEEAIKLYKSAFESGKPFSAVILDLTVHGGMGGKETIGKLLELDPNVKAIVSSGYFNDPVMANFREYGFKGVIAKPYKIKELSEVLHNVITGGNNG